MLMRSINVDYAVLLRQALISEQFTLGIGLLSNGNNQRAIGGSLGANQQRQASFFYHLD
jgi:hypothetical protein